VDRPAKIVTIYPARRRHCEPRRGAAIQSDGPEIATALRDDGDKGVSLADIT